MRISHFLAIAGVAIGIAGCSQKPVVQGVGPQLTEADMPHPKPGLWAVKSAVTGARQSCLSGQLLPLFTVRTDCTQNSRQRSADGGVMMDSRCQSSSGSSHVMTSATGDYQSAFAVNLVMSSSNGPSIKDHLDYTFVGPCAAGQHPDDQP